MGYITSSGLREFVAAHKKVKGNMVLKNVSDNVKNILKTTGLSKRINIEKTANCINQITLQGVQPFDIEKSGASPLTLSTV